MAAAGRWKKEFELGAGAVIHDFVVTRTGDAALCGEINKVAVVAVCRNGSEWVKHSMPDGCSSVFVGPGSTIWMVTGRGAEVSRDDGATHALSAGDARLRRIYFVNEQHGYAVGTEKTILETTDGGANWERLAAAEQVETNPETTSFHWIDFVTPRVGIITGSSKPPRKGLTGPMPAWRDPNKQERRPEWPGASITLETRDGGTSWKHTSTSLFGRMSKVLYSRDGRGLALLEFHDAFEWPSEIFSIDLRGGKSERAYREKTRAVTDIYLQAGGNGYLAAIEPPKDPSVSTLGRVHVLESEDLRVWREMELPVLDAGRVWIAGSEQKLWLATDGGVVLRAG